MEKHQYYTGKTTFWTIFNPEKRCHKWFLGDFSNLEKSCFIFRMNQKTKKVLTPIPQF